MHPSLHLRQLENLPPKLKRMATSAAQSSAQDVTSLLQMAQNGVITDSQLITLLPAFHATLDAARIPDEAALEEMVAQGWYTPNIASALMSLRLLTCMSKPHPDTYRDIFAHLYLVHLQFRKSPSTEHIYLAAMRLIDHMAREWDKKLVVMTTGVRAVVARSWVLFLESANTDGLDAICGFLGLDGRDGFDTSWMDGYVEGAGGTLYDLGATLVRHMKYALDKTRGPIAKRALAIAAGGLFLLDMAKPDDPPTTGALYFPALVADGLVSVLTEAVCALSAVITVEPSMPMLVGKLLSLLGQLCMVGYLPLIEALQAGLLRAILSFSSAEKDTGELQIFLTDLIPRRLVYRNALVCMPKAMNEVRDLVNTRAFQECDLHQPWLTFREFVDERIRFLTLFDDARRIALKACDNLECGHIQDRHKFKRCSGCLDFHYCSRECQSIDWNAGHRQKCITFRSVPMQETLGHRDLAFIRELALADFLRNRSDIITQTVTALAEQPSVPLCTNFDYSGGRHAVIEVAPDLDWEGSDYLVARSQHSKGGEVALHRITVANGPETVSRKFHLRFADTQLSEGMRLLAKSLPPPGDARQAAIETGVRELMDLDIVAAY
ncbi:hypothetical protein DFH06DRAFT_1467238 [Mycena polygramma]|nr:hypothetical protein DFH06DRAFT_1467238 [Mycena polygramma]